MSAFLVDGEVIDRLAVALVEGVQVKDHRVGNPAYSDERFAPFRAGSPVTVALDLRGLNRRALNARYSDPLGDPDGYGFVRRPALSPVWVYKQLGCFLYQCAEGDVPKEALYTAVEEFKRDLAEALVHQMPEYDAQPWGDVSEERPQTRAVPASDKPEARFIVVSDGGAPAIVNATADLPDLQRLVGGYIEDATGVFLPGFLPRGVNVLVNEDGIAKDLTPHVVHGVLLRGPVVFVGTTGDDYCGLNKKQIAALGRRLA